MDVHHHAKCFNTRYVKERRCVVGVEGITSRMPNPSSPRAWAIRAKEVEHATLQLFGSVGVLQESARED